MGLDVPPPKEVMFGAGDARRGGQFLVAALYGNVGQGKVGGCQAGVDVSRPVVVEGEDRRQGNLSVGQLLHERLVVSGILHFKADTEVFAGDFQDVLQDAFGFAVLKVGEGGLMAGAAGVDDRMGVQVSPFFPVENQGRGGAGTGTARFGAEVWLDAQGFLKAGLQRRAQRLIPLADRQIEVRGKQDAFHRDGIVKEAAAGQVAPQGALTVVDVELLRVVVRDELQVMETVVGGGKPGEFQHGRVKWRQIAHPQFAALRQRVTAKGAGEIDRGLANVTADEIAAGGVIGVRRDDPGQGVDVTGFQRTLC